MALGEDMSRAHLHEPAGSAKMGFAKNILAGYGYCLGILVPRTLQFMAELS